MDAETLATLIVFAGFAVALFTYLASMKRDLRSEMSARFDLVDEKFEQVDRRFDRESAVADARFAMIDERFGRLDARVDRLEVQVTDLRHEMRAGFSEVGSRLSVLEQRTYDLGARRPDAS